MVDVGGLRWMHEVNDVTELLPDSADNEEFMIFWVGSSVEREVLFDLFGVDDLMVLDPHMVCVLMHILRFSLDSYSSLTVAMRRPNSPC